MRIVITCLSVHLLNILNDCSEATGPVWIEFHMAPPWNGIATDKRGSHIIFFLFLHENICYGYSLEVLLMSTHNMCFRGEIRKISAFFG